jgi:Raf kinase inhibitor-like YbhB/YbcL family protein
MPITTRREAMLASPAVLVALAVMASLCALSLGCPRAVAQERFVLRSSTFADGATMPLATAYDGDGCGGANRSPELQWSGAPPGTKGFALTVHDPDAPVAGGFWHWVIVDIPAGVSRLDEDAGRGTSAPAGSVEATSSFGSTGYGGPCPPPGKPHHYVFTLYALDVATLGDAGPHTTGPQLDALLAGHTLGKAALVGLFGR